MPYQGKKQQQVPEENKKARPEEQFIPEQRTFGMPNSLMTAVPMTQPGTPNSVMREMNADDSGALFRGRGFDPTVGAHELSHTVRREPAHGPVSLSVPSGTIQRSSSARGGWEANLREGNEPPSVAPNERDAVAENQQVLLKDAEQMATQCRDIILNKEIDKDIAYLMELEGDSGIWHFVNKELPDVEIKYVNPILNYVRDCRRDNGRITPEGIQMVQENYAQCQWFYQKCQQAIQMGHGGVLMGDFTEVEGNKTSTSTTSTTSASYGNGSYGELGSAVSSYVAGSQYRAPQKEEPSTLRKLGNAISGAVSSVAKHLPWKK